MTDTIFETPETPVIDETKDYFAEFVGEGKKFKTPQDLARSILHKDAFIDQLKTEGAELRKEIKTRLTMEDLLTKIESNQRTSAPSTPVEPPPSEPTRQTPQPDLEGEITKALNRAEAERTAKANREKVRETLAKHYGENYAVRVKQEAQKLGVGEEFLDSVAAKSPDAVYKLLGIGEAPQRAGEVSPPVSSATSFRPNVSGERNYAYYKTLQNKMGNAVFFADYKLQNQMHQDAIRLGEGFYS